MKRYIKSSFGYTDSSWVEPDEDNWSDLEYDTVAVDVRVLFTTDETGYIEDIFKVLDSHNAPLYDSDTYSAIVDKKVSDVETIEDGVWEYLTEHVQKEVQPNSRYVLTGTVVIGFSYTKYLGILGPYDDPYDASEVEDILWVHFEPKTLDRSK